MVLISVLFPPEPNSAPAGGAGGPANQRQTMRSVFASLILDAVGFSLIDGMNRLTIRHFRGQGTQVQGTQVLVDATFRDEEGDLLDFRLCATSRRLEALPADERGRQSRAHHLIGLDAHLLDLASSAATLPATTIHDLPITGTPFRWRLGKDDKLVPPPRPRRRAKP